MPQTIETTVYNFKELSDDAKEKAREWWREAAFDHEWYDFTYEDAKNMASLMGIEIDKIYFSGFSCQGDGAQFNGFYSYNKGSVKKVKDQAPKDEELHRIVTELYEFQCRYFFSVQATIKTSGHYSHSGCTSIDGADRHGDLDHEENATLTQILRDYMDWIYGQLEAEYNYQNADEQVDDSIRANEYTFTENGRRFG